MEEEEEKNQFWRTGCSLLGLDLQRRDPGRRTAGYKLITSKLCYQNSSSQPNTTYQ